MKTRKIFRHACVIVMIVAGYSVALSNKADEDKISAFEKEYATTLSSDEKKTKIVGCKIFELGEAKDEFKAFMESNPEELAKIKTNGYIAEDYSSYRMYFPVNSAIIDCEGARYIADEKGVVSLPDSCDVSKIKVLGRKKSENVTGTPDNIIVGDSIFLKDALIQGVNSEGVTTGYFHKKEKICVFMFVKEWNM